MGEGLGPLEWIQDYKIPHPGRVSGQFILKGFMPIILDWILSGNMKALQFSQFYPYCRLLDVPRHYSLNDFREFMRDDTLLRRSARADWLVVPAGASTVDEVKAVKSLLMSHLWMQMQCLLADCACCKPECLTGLMSK